MVHLGTGQLPLPMQPNMIVSPDLGGVTQTERVLRARIFAALKPYCRKIVVNAADRFALPRDQKRQNSLQNQVLSLVEMGDSNPRPLTYFARSQIDP
jgi:hypothetical protein